MSSLNRVMLIGHVGKDPEIRSFQNGGRVCNFSLATSESWKEKATGDRKERTEWHRVVLFNEQLIGVAEQFIRKGAKLFVEGQLETRKYADQSGNERSTTEVVLRSFNGTLKMLDRRPDQEGTGTAATAQQAAMSDEIPW